MAKFVQTLVPLLSSIALLLALAKTAQSQDSLSFSYDFNGDEPITLRYLNDAHFPPTTSTYLRLTKANYTAGPNVALPNSIGRVVHRMPMLFKRTGAQADFETTLKFKITPFSNPPADGLTFFLYPDGTSLPSDSTGSNLGIFSDSKVAVNTFAVEFDIFADRKLDPSYRHVGIDIGSKISRNTTEIGEAMLGQVVTARITYVSATNLIDVQVTAGPRTFQVSYVYDLARLLPDWVVVGLSAATGVNVANHDIISWSFTSTITANGDTHIRQIV